MEGNTLRGWSDIIDKQFEQSKQKDEEFNKQLSEPAMTLIFEEDEYGYWKVEGGVVRLRKLKNGYNRHSEVFFSEMEINAINKAWR